MLKFFITPDRKDQKHILVDQKGDHMKSLAELYEEIIASDDLKKELAEAGKDKEALAEFLKKHDCSATVDEFFEDLSVNFLWIFQTFSRLENLCCI